MAKGGQSTVLGENMDCMKIGYTAMLFNKLPNIQNICNILHKGLTLVALHTKKKNDAMKLTEI